MIPESFQPKLFSVLREGYSRDQFFRDLGAGIIVGIVALPLAIAFGIASGVKPEQGLITAVVAGFVISALSGSRVQIGGPTGAFVVIVAAIVAEHGYAGLAVATLMAGVLLILMGLARMGAVIQFIPYPVTIGFTSGIALIIAAGQLGDFFGLTLSPGPPDFIHKMRETLAHLDTLNGWALAIGVATVLIVQFWPRLTRRLPGSLVAMLLTTAVVAIFDLPVETIGSRFQSVSGTIPSPSLPDFDWSQIRSLISPAVTIALLGGIESLLSAVVADGMTGRRHRPNAELIAQGVANLVTPLFGGIPATGAIARTATNVRNGGRTPIAGLIHALTLMMIMLFFGKWAAYIPMAALAGILLVVAWNMSEAHNFIGMLKSPGGDVLVLLLTFGLTVMVDLTVAIQVGVVLAALLFMRRMVAATEMEWASSALTEEEEVIDSADGHSPRFPRHLIPEGVEVFEINGPFFFGAAEKFRSALMRVEAPPRVLILHLARVPFLDATALHVLEEFCHGAVRNHTDLIFSGLKPEVHSALQKSGIFKKLSQVRFSDDLPSAVKQAQQWISETPPKDHL